MNKTLRSDLQEVHDALIEWGERSTAALVADAMQQVDILIEENVSLRETLELIRTVTRERF
jgi:hypothetical protein